MKAVFRYIFTIILTISLLLYFLINILTYTIMDKNFILDKLEETGYYDKILGYATSNFENYIIQSGLDKSVLDGIITREDVVNDTLKILNNIYTNIEEQINGENLKTRLQANVDNATKDMQLTDDQKASLKGFVDEIAKDYFNSIAHFDFEKTIFNAYHKADFVLDMTNKTALIFIGVSIFGLAVASSRRFYKFFTFIGIALVSIGTFFIVVNIFVNAKVNIHTITVLNDALSFTLREILSTIFSEMLGKGILMIFGGLILIISSNLLHNYFKYRNRYYDDENKKQKVKKIRRKKRKPKLLAEKNSMKKEEKSLEKNNNEKKSKENKEIKKEEPVTEKITENKQNIENKENEKSAENKENEKLAENRENEKVEDEEKIEKLKKLIQEENNKEKN